METSSNQKNKQVTQDTKPDHGKLLQWLEYGQAISKQRFWDYFVIDQMLRGNQNIKGNPNDNTIQVSRATDQISYPINKLYSTFRAVRAFVTRHKPVIDVDPANSSEQAKTNARRNTKIIERDNKLNNYRRINKEWAYYGIKYGIGWRQIGYDPIKKVCIRWTVDPNDVVVGAPDGRFEDAPYLIKTVKRTVGYVKDKYKDKQASISPDGEVASNEYAALARQINQVTAYGQKQTPDEDTILLHECWYRLLTPNSKGGLINKCTFTETDDLDFEETPYKEYPFIPYYSSVTPNEIGSEGHLKHVIPAQRMLNMLNTQMLEYNHLVNRGRFLVQKGSGFRIIYSKEGHIIQYNTGKRPEVLNPPAVSSMLDRQMQYSLDFIEDLGGQHDASMGATPQRVSSGDAIEALQQGDSNNISDLRDNFEDALALEAAWILKMYSLFEADGVQATDTVDKKEVPFVAYGKVAMEKAGKSMPEKYYMEDNGTYCDTCSILEDNHVKVSVVSQLGETKDARMNLLFKLVDMGVISGRSVLQHLEFPNVDDLLENLASEELAAIALEQMKPPPVPPGGGPPQAPGGGEVLPTPDGNTQALEEMNSMLSQVQPTSSSENGTQ